MALSPLQKLKQLDDERTKILAGAKAEALSGANEAVAALNALGFSYRLVEGGRAGARKGTRTPKDAPCPVCGFKTSPLHDGRAHRTHKAAFTEADLRERGMRKA